MINLKSIAATIEGLLAENTPQSITYAALECRLAMEKICYERLKVAHDYIAHDDLRGWRPGDVMTTLITDVDGGAASTYQANHRTRINSPSKRYRIQNGQKLGRKLVLTPN